MTDLSNRTFVCSVLFLDIVEYSKRSVSEQLRLKQRFNAMLVEALRHVATSDRIVLDTGDGAAISFLGNPEDSLFVAIDLRDLIVAENPNESPALLVRIGINLGPVRLIKDINAQLNIIGDGINVAQRVMSFGEPGTILVSRSYYEVVSRLSDDYHQIFHDAGTRTDKHVREHSVYAVGPASADVHRVVQNREIDAGESEVRSNHARTFAGAAARVHSGRIRLPYMLGAPLLAAAIISAAVGIRHSREKAVPQADDLAASLPAASHPVVPAEPAASAVPAAAAVSSAVPAAPAVPAVPRAVAATPVANPPPRDKPAAKASVNNPKTPAPLPLGEVAFSILPWGDIYVDGKERGVCPPLTSLSLSAGSHTVEIRNAAFPVHTEIIEVKGGSSLKIRYRFQ